MPRVKQLAVLGAAALAAATVAGPAHAAGTGIHKVSDGTLYSGNVRASLTGNLVVNGGGTTTCTSAALNGNVDSDGDPLNITSASVGGCSGVASSITFNTPWAGTVTYDSSHLNGRDAVISLTGFSVQATVHIPIFNVNVNCIYGGNVSANGFNGSGGGDATVNMAGIVINKTGGNILCPGSATINQGVFQLRGESSPGTFDVALYVASS